MKATPQAMSRNENGGLKTSFSVDRRMPPSSRWQRQSPSTSLRYCGPLLLELRQRGGVHHRAAGSELMDMDVDHACCLLGGNHRTVEQSRPASKPSNAN